MSTWRTGPDGQRTWYVPAHCACAAAMVEHDELNDEQSERLAAALREIDAKKAAGSDEVVHYAPGDSPLCGEDVIDAVCTHEPEAVAGCVDCLELVIEDLGDRDLHQGTCPHCGRPGW